MKEYWMYNTYTKKFECVEVDDETYSELGVRKSTRRKPFKTKYVSLSLARQRMAITKILTNL